VDVDLLKTNGAALNLWKRVSSGVHAEEAAKLAFTYKLPIQKVITLSNDAARESPTPTPLPAAKLGP